MDSSVMEGSSFSSLPIEMKMEIFDYLDPDMKRSGRAVCKDWELILSQNFTFSFELSDVKTACVLHTNKIITRLVVDNLRKPLCISSTRRDLSSTSELVIEQGVSVLNVRKLLANCPNIWHLRLTQPNMQMLRTIEKIRSVYRMENLTELILALPKFQPHQTGFIRKLAEIHSPFPSLSSFEIRWAFTKLMDSKFQSFFEMYLWVHRFIWKHASTLNALETDFSEIYCSGWHNRDIIFSQCMQKMHKELIDSEPPKIYMITVGFPQHEGEFPWNLSTILTLSQKSLLKAAIDLESVVIDTPPYDMIKDVYSNNTNLLSITIMLPDSISLDCANLSNCDQLIYLYVQTSDYIRNIEKLPTGLIKLTLEGRPALASFDRRWIAENLLSLQHLRINLLSHPLLYQFDDSQELVSADLARFLRLPNITSIHATTYSWYRYDDILFLSRYLGFKHTSKYSIDYYHINLEFVKNGFCSPMVRVNNTNIPGFC